MRQDGLWSKYPDAEQILRAAWCIEEKSASQIASVLTKRFGERFTRNAVTGKVHRLHLPPRTKNTTAPVRHVARTSIQTSTSSETAQLKTPSLAYTPRAQNTAPVQDEVVIPHSSASIKVIFAHEVTFAQYEPGVHCGVILHDGLRCGLKKKGPFCEKHGKNLTQAPSGASGYPVPNKFMAKRH